MPLRLICCVAYLCETLCDWRQADYDTLKLTKALKGKEINGYKCEDR